MIKSTFLLTSMALLAFGTSQAQMSDSMQPKIVQDHYTVSGGLLGAANFNKFRVAGNDAFSYDFKPGWSAGIWLNMPATNWFSIEPQVQFSQLYYKQKDEPFVNNALMSDGHLSYISVPIQLKFNLGKALAIGVGPQGDFFMNKGKNGDVDVNNDNYTKALFSVFGGLELFPHGRVSLYGRYIHTITSSEDIRIPTMDTRYYNQQIQAGVKLKLFGKHIDADSDGDGIIDKQDKCISEFGYLRYEGCPIPDTDKDGLNDEIDKCPTVPGLERYQGCPIPDTDNDGVNDEEDKCPTVAGLPKYNGCPIPDTDGDGINDEEDKCPTVAGVAEYQGCPIPDTDGDGVLDNEDRCPNTPGVPEMKGCPKIATFQAQRVTFASGKSVLTAAGKKELDMVVNFMKNEAADAKINLVGHTDNTGNDKINDPLSQARADAAKVYIVSQGIDETRISTSGMGSKEPVADNKTVKGRAMNRRVEVTMQ